MKQLILSQTLKHLINTIKAWPSLREEDFVFVVSEAFSDFDCPFEYDHDFTIGRHSIRLKDQPQLAVDITWSNAAEAAQELEWFLNYLTTDNIDLELS